MRTVVVCHLLCFLAFFWVAECEHTVYITYERVTLQYEVNLLKIQYSDYLPFHLFLSDYQRTGVTRHSN